MATDDRLPYWPATLNQKMAAAYCGISVDLFTKLCPLKPIEFTESAWGRRYLRKRLDEWLVSLDPNGPDLTDKPKESRMLEFEDFFGNRAPRNQKGPGGYPIVDDDPSSPLYDYYKKLGFNPHTMDQEDMNRLVKKNRDEWAAWLPGQPLGKREKTALGQLAAFGPNIDIEWTKIKNCGPDTEERLKARGFLQTKPSKKFPDRIGFYMLTQAGYDAWQNRKE